MAMYQRRGLANAQLASDNEARNTNFSLMHQKRRQQLQAQLEEKQMLLKQYTNPRGIGMGGQTVPARDVELLQQQIAQIHAQLNGEDTSSQQGSAPPTPSSVGGRGGVGVGGVSNRQGPGMQPGQQLPVTPTALGAGPGSVVSQPPARPQQGGGGLSALGGGPGSAPRAPTGASSSVGGGSSKREIVWQRKYQQWLERRSQSATPSAGPAVPPLSGMASNAPASIFDRQNAVPSYAQASPDRSSARSSQAPWEQQQQQPQQQQPQFGRRATPPTGTPGGPAPVWTQQQQQQPQQSNRSQGAPWQQQQQQQQQQQPPASNRSQGAPWQQQQPPQQPQMSNRSQQQQPAPWQQQQPAPAPMHHQQQPQQSNRSQGAPWEQQHQQPQASNRSQQPAPWQQQQAPAQQQQQQPQFGRRASANSGSRPW